MAASTKRTRYPGVFRVKDRYQVKASRRHPITGKIVHRKRMLPKGASLDDAKAARAELDEHLVCELEADAATLRAPEPSRAATTTVASYALAFLKGKKSRFKPSTLGRYESTLGDWVLPQLGHLSVTDVTRPVVKRWVTWAESRTKGDEPYAAATLAGVWRVTKQVLQEMAADYGLADPTFKVLGPTSRRRNTREQQTLSAEQLTAVVEASKALPDWHAEVAVICRTGLRPGELYALHWDDLDADSRMLNIRRSVYRGRVDTTKTDSPRSVALPEEVVEAIQAHRRRLVEGEHKAAWGDLMFPSEAATHRTTAALTKTLGLLAKAAGIEDLHVTPQVVRRSVNTALVEAGVNEVVIRAIMGHSSRKMTQLYANVGEPAKREAVKALLST